MPQYYPELPDALAKVEKMTVEECLEHIDYLYGRHKLRHGATEAEIRQECRNQVKEDFTDFSYVGYFGEKAKRNY